MISKEEASCLFYCKPFEEGNVKTCMQNIEKSPDVDLCYINNPDEPMLICKFRIFGSRVYKLYKLKRELEDEAAKANEAAKSDDKEDVTLENDSQIIDFLNHIYRPKEEYLFDSRYKLISVHDKDILSVIWKFTHKFDKKAPLGFSQWLNKNNVDLTSTEPERKITKTSSEIRARSRQLSVLHEISYVSVAEDILKVLPSHQKSINDLKEDGYQVVGYCRKSVVESENRVGCLQRMVNVLYSRSLVDKVFVSPCSSTKQQFMKRDSSDNDQILSQLNNIHGNTVDFLNFLKNNSKICVVAIDYAGLTTNVSDLKKLLNENPSLKKVIIDQYFYENHFKYFNNDQLLNNPMDSKAFDCRSKPKQRGK